VVGRALEYCGGAMGGKVGEMNQSIQLSLVV